MNEEDEKDEVEPEASSGYPRMKLQVEIGRDFPVTDATIKTPFFRATFKAEGTATSLAIYAVAFMVLCILGVGAYLILF